MPQTDIKPAIDKITAQAAKFKIYNDYYKGAHELNFASDKFKNKFGERLQKLRTNLSRLVVQAPCSRLEVIGFQADKKDLEKSSWEIWKRNKMPRKAKIAHREAVKTGEAYLIAWVGANDKSTIDVQSSANVCVWVSKETGEIQKAAKLWVESDKKWYLTLYYKDSIEKYISMENTGSGMPSAADFIPREVPGESFPLSNPTGKVPVFRFVFNEETDGVGTSILEDVIPINDALNKTFADIMGANEENMRRRRYVAGMQVEVDEETGKKINPFKYDDDILFADESETKFGEFSDVDITQMLELKRECARDVSLVSGIPPSYLNLDETQSALSGEALRKIEARFTAIILDAQLTFGETWAAVESYCHLLEDIIQADVAIETQWTDAAPVSETEQLDNAQKKINLGWSYEQVQRDFGLSDEQIEKMKNENLAREQSKMDMQMKSFDAGNSLVE